MLILLLALFLLACETESPFPEETKVVWLENNADVDVHMGAEGNLVNVPAGVFLTTKVTIPEGMEKVSMQFVADPGQAVTTECFVEREGRMKVVFEEGKVYCEYPN